mgnify:CR=1 FL=1
MKTTILRISSIFLLFSLIRQAVRKMKLIADESIETLPILEYKFSPNQIERHEQ